VNITKSQAKSLLQLLQDIPELKDILHNCPDYFENLSFNCAQGGCNNCWRNSLDKFIQK
jgi:hypothetical protein